MEFNAKNWYPYVNHLCKSLAISHNLEVWQIAGILVSFSGQKKWKDNIQQTRDFLDNIPLKGMFSSAQLNAAERIRSGENPFDVWNKNSSKYREFYKSILLIDGACCVDSHMIKFYFKTFPTSKLPKDFTKIFSSPKLYKVVQNWIIKQARQQGLQSYEMQSILWCEIRGTHE